MIRRFRSHTLLVVLGLLCLATLTFYFTMAKYDPGKVNSKHFPNYKQEFSDGAPETNLHWEISTYSRKERFANETRNKKVNTSSTDFTNFVINILHGKASDEERSNMQNKSIPVQISEARPIKKAESKNLRGRYFTTGHEMVDTNTNVLNPVMNEIAQNTKKFRNTNTQFHILPHSIIEDDNRAKFPVHFAAFNLTQDTQHIYTLSNQYPSSEGGSFVCIPTRTIPSFKICVFPIKKDIYVSGSIQQSGSWDYEQTLLIQKALNTFPEAIFIDIGANIGYFSLLARAMGRAVIAIEPTDANFIRLQEGVVRNNFSDNMLMLKYAISDERKTVIMGEDDHNQGGIAVSREIDGPANISRSAEAITLNDLVKLILAKEMIIKMDIEGYECKAIFSSMELLQKFKVRYIFMEWLIMPQNQDQKDTPCPKANILHMLASMYSMGFRPYSVHGRALDINKSGSWKTTDIYWKPDNSPNLFDIYVV